MVSVEIYQQQVMEQPLLDEEFEVQASLDLDNDSPQNT